MISQTWRSLAERLCSDLQEARDSVAEWADYASDYFQQKHDLAGELSRIDRQIASARAEFAAPPPLTPEQQEALAALDRLLQHCSDNTGEAALRRFILGEAGE